MADRATTPRPRLYVLAGVNGAGKSSIGGAIIRAFGADYYNADEIARALLTTHRGINQTEANTLAWQQGKRLLERAIHERLDFAIETTLGGNTMLRLLSQAAAAGFEVRVWYIGLASPEAHIERVRQRVSGGGHDIPESDIRRRFQHSRQNLIRLMPALTELRVYDNSAVADPAAGQAPQPMLVLHVDRGRIIAPGDLAQLSRTPQWAKPFVVAANL